MAISVDVAVVGGGAAGLSAAYQARRRDASVALVERRRLGGECTWSGCVPSKTLIEQARRVHAAHRLGLDGDVDFGAVMETVRQVIAKIGKEEDRTALEAMGVNVLEGQASFTGLRQLDVDGTRVRAKAVIIATGSAPLVPPVDGLADASPLTNESVFDLTSLPARLAVVGGGAIGLELGQAFGRLGSEVTLIEALDRLVSREEPETSRVLAEVLQAEGITLAVGEQLEAVTPSATASWTLTTSARRQLEVDSVLVAVGRRPVTDGLEPQRGGIELDDKGLITVDAQLRTSADGVYAVGDVTGGQQFTHVGYDAGALAVSNALGRRQRPFDTRTVPWVTFTDPEVGRVGMSEAQAHDEYGDQAQVAYLPIAETDRAKTTGEVAGFVKLIAGPHPVLRGLAGGRLLGGTVVCPTGGDVIHEVALGMRARCVTGRLAQTIHAYPSWSLAVREAAVQFFRTHKGRRSRPCQPA